MKCQIPFSGKNEKNIINLPNAEFAHSVLGINSGPVFLPSQVVSSFSKNQWVMECGEADFIVFQ